jgi:acyl dehydratase
MSLDLSAVGYTTEPSSFTYDWKAVVLYALGIGAKKDELDYLSEGKGPKVYPTFAVVPVMSVVLGCVGKTGGNPAMIMHGGQSIRLHRLIPPEGKLLTTATVKGVYDLKKMGQVVIESNTKLESGEPVFDTTWSLIFRGGGGFDGPPPPRQETPDVPKDRPADFRVEQVTAPEQALIYRLSGDLNPLHSDPEFAAMVGFPQGPVLHGLATYGYVARAIIKSACGGDAGKLKRFDAQFRKPVWPGDTIVTEGWKVDGGKVAVVGSVKERPDPVVTGCWAQIG